VGLEILVDGRRYEGQFANDAWHGEGKFYGSDGSVIIGRWEKGNRVEVMKEYNLSANEFNDLKRRNYEEVLEIQKREIIMRANWMYSKLDSQE